MMQSLTQPTEDGPRIVWEEVDGSLRPRVEGMPDAPEIAWCPQPGSQMAFLTSPVTETCYEGTRGPGKTDALIMDFVQHCGPDDRTSADIAAGAPKLRGWGAEWRGVLFRRTYPELQDVIDKSKKWIRRIHPEARFNEAKTFWEWPTGEKLFFRQFARPADYWSYHGHAYPWIGWEELTTWPNDECFKSMFSCSRSTAKGIPIKIRATTNPFGAGHNWVKIRYRLPVSPGHIIGELIDDSMDELGILEPPRIAIHGTLQENRILLHADPSYVSRLVASAPNAAALEAWLKGSWDIIAGGMFDDVWYHAKRHAVVPRFVVPTNWYIDRSFDWGDSRPFSVGWWAESNGEDLVLPDGRSLATVRGDVFRIAEWYGWTGKPNEGVKMLADKIAEGIAEREIRLGIAGRVNAGRADSMIFNEVGRSSVARDMARKIRLKGRAVPGIRWLPADKSRGSRVQGWQQIRQRLANTIPVEGGARERPGLFITDVCKQWLRTVPVLPRDDKDPLDVDTEAEDHIGDDTRYRLLTARRKSKTGVTVGAH